MDRQRIAFIGLGTMGLPMAENLMAAGFRVVGFDLSARSCEGFKASGGSIATSAAGAAEGVDLVIAMLPNADNVRDALFGGDGAAQAMSREAVFINMSTILHRRRTRSALR